MVIFLYIHLLLPFLTITAVSGRKTKESKFMDCKCLESLDKNVNSCVPLLCPGNYQDHLLPTVNKRPMVATASMFWGICHISLVLVQISFHS